METNNLGTSSLGVALADLRARLLSIGRELAPPAATTATSVAAAAATSVAAAAATARPSFQEPVRALTPPPVYSQQPSSSVATATRPAARAESKGDEKTAQTGAVVPKTPESAWKQRIQRTLN